MSAFLMMILSSGTAQRASLGRGVGISRSATLREIVYASMHTLNPVRDPPSPERFMITPVALDNVTFLGSGLKRPKCLVTHESGWIFAADWEGSGGIACIAPDGAVRRLQARRPAEDPLRPNGIALEPGGTFLAAHLGAETGGLFRVHPDGTCEPVLLTLGDEPLPPLQFPDARPEGPDLVDRIHPQGAARAGLPARRQDRVHRPDR